MNSHNNNHDESLQFTIIAILLIPLYILLGLLLLLLWSIVPYGRSAFFNPCLIVGETYLLISTIVT